MDQTNLPILNFGTLGSPLTNAGGIVSFISANRFEGICANPACSSQILIRNVTSGSLSAVLLWVFAD